VIYFSDGNRVARNYRERVGLVGRAKAGAKADEGQEGALYWQPSKLTERNATREMRRKRIKMSGRWQLARNQVLRHS